MNTYFQNLIERSTKAQGDIRPRVPSVFESGAPQMTQLVPDLDAEENETASTTFQASEKRAPAMQPAVPDAFRSATPGGQNIPETRTGQEEKSAFTHPGKRRPSPQTDFAPARNRASEQKTVVESLQNVSRFFMSQPRAAEVMTPSAENTSLSATQNTSGKAVSQLLQNEASNAGPSAGETFFPMSKTTDGRTFSNDAMETSAPAPLKAFRLPDDGSSPSPAARPPRVTPLISKQPGALTPQTLRAADNSAIPFNEPAARQAEPEKTIRVTIGRIDVRAILPPSPAPAARPKEAQPKISLEDYLKKQRGGSR